MSPEYTLHLHLLQNIRVLLSRATRPQPGLAAPARVQAWLKPKYPVAGFSRGADWTSYPMALRDFPALGELP